MARKVKDADLDTRTAREKLKIRGKPHFRRIEEGLHIGYRRLRGKSGTWTARHYAGNGDYAWDVIGTADDRSDADNVTVFSFDQAVAKARALHTERARQAAGIHGPLTVDQAMAAYVTHLDQNGKNTNHVERIVARYITPKIGSEEVAKLTSEMVNAWKAQVAAMPARRRSYDARSRKASANKTLAILRAGLNLAYRNEKVPSNAAWRSIKPFEGVHHPRLRFLTVSEAKRLINAAGDEFRPMIQAALATGCRYSELCNLKISDFHIDHRTLHISQTKTGKPRDIFLTDEGVALFESLAAGRKRSEPLIRRADGLPFGTAHQIRRMKVACENARIETVTFHGLRHSYASALVKAGVPLIYVARSLGHTTTKMVEAVYGHIQESHLAETIRQSVPVYDFAKSNVTTIKRPA
jgi:integrase